jgi:N-acetylneuraminate lyase
MNNKQFSGIMPALITPIDKEGHLLENAARALIDWQLSQGVDGFYICGHTGEGPALSEETRRRMTQLTVVQVAGRGKIICHVGAADAYSSLRLAKHACEVGCDAVASLPPTGYYDYSENEIFDYYKALGEATLLPKVSPLPMIVYANAMFKQQNLAPFIAHLMALPTAIGVKFTRNNFYEMRNIIELCGGDINMINGPDEMLINGLTMGADAGIGSTYNVMPGHYVKLYEAFMAGDFETARQAQFEINRIIRVIIKYGVIRTVKQTLCEMGFDVGGPAFPGRGFSPDEAKQLRKDMEEAGFCYEI